MGKPARSNCELNTARESSPRARMILRSSFTVINGMSQARNNTSSALVLSNPVRMPPSGPQRGPMSRRMTRTRRLVPRATARTMDNMVRPHNRSRALSRPIRVLFPPVRMQISIREWRSFDPAGRGARAGRGTGSLFTNGGRRRREFPTASRAAPTPTG